MMKATKGFGYFLASLIFGSGVACADDTGRAEYLNACASCHGIDARGDGPMVELLNVEVPALTRLSKENEGNFPMLKVIHTIDGRQSQRGHGNPMPIWGQNFSNQTKIDGLGPYGGEAVVRGRILSIAYYLESVQEQ
jgi:mono/diheme cytochrome c family protein